MSQIITMDIGGTNARVGRSTPDGLDNVKFYSCEDYPTPLAVMEAYREDHPDIDFSEIRQGVVAVAGPIDNPAAHHCTNGPWSGKATDFTNLGLHVHLLNDFAAQAYALLVLKVEDYKEILPGNGKFFMPSALSVQQENAMAASPHGIVANSPADERLTIIGPGTGLGVAHTVTVNGHYVVVESEGSHGSLPIRSVRDELNVLARMQKTSGNLSFESIACGPGLVRTFNALNKGGKQFNPLQDSIAVEGLARQNDEKALKAVDLFTRVLGRCAGTNAVSQNSRGGFVIVGDLIGKLGDLFDTAAFAEEFHCNDFSYEANFARHIPVRMVTAEHTGLLGAHAYAQHAMPG